MSAEREISTYRDLRDYLNTLTAAELDQPVQILPHWSDGDRPAPLHVAIAIGTVGALECDPTRSSFDNDHHPESIVILTDGNPFAEDGSIGEDLMTGEPVWPADRVRDWSNHDGRER